MSSINTISKSCDTSIEIKQGKTLNINSKLEEFHKNQLIKLLQKHYGAFAWEYTNMR
jgi:hypothetical protein